MEYIIDKLALILRNHRLNKARVKTKKQTKKLGNSITQFEKDLRSVLTSDLIISNMYDALHDISIEVNKGRRDLEGQEVIMNSVFVKELGSMSKGQLDRFSEYLYRVTMALESKKLPDSFYFYKYQLTGDTISPASLNLVINSIIKPMLKLKGSTLLVGKIDQMLPQVEALQLPPKEVERSTLGGSDYKMVLRNSSNIMLGSGRSNDKVTRISVSKEGL